MNYPKVAVMLQDNQQKTIETKNAALATSWQSVENWTELENEIIRAWASLDSTYQVPAYIPLDSSRGI